MMLVLKISGDFPTGAGVQQSCSFDTFGGSIGRERDNTWVLPDPSLKVSRKHFKIDFDSGSFWLTDTSANGVFLNYSPGRLQPDQRVRLNNGDHLRAGDYEIDVWIESPARAEGPSSDTFSAVLRSSPLPPVSDGIDDLLEPRHSAASSPSRGDSIPYPPSPSVPSTPRTGGNPFQLEDDSEFAPSPSPGPAPLSTVTPHLSTGIFSPDEDDSLWGAPRPITPPVAGAFPDHLPSENQFFSPPAVSASKLRKEEDGAGGKPMASGLPDDWDDEFGDLLKKEPGPSVVAPPVAAPASNNPEVPSSPPPSPSPTPPPVVAPPPAVRSVDEGALWTAFLEGAGIDPALVPKTEVEAALRQAGALYRAAVGGIRDLLLARSALKNELRIEQTMVQARGNNPLKFYATAEEALTALVGLPRPGYLAGPVAIDEAVSDLKAHEMAMLSGLQDAMLALLARLNPVALEQRLAAVGGAGGVIPATRKAKCWDAFCLHYAQVAEQTEGDASSVMGRDFATAYLHQVGKMGD